MNKTSMSKIFVAIFDITVLISAMYCGLVEANINSASFDLVGKEKWVVIVCGGCKNIEHWWERIMAGAEIIRKTAIHTYETFKQLGYDDQHIYFIVDRDVPCNGKDAVVSKETVRYAITSWLKNHSDDNDDICVILHCHGHFRSLQHDGKAFVGIWNNETQEWEYIYDRELDSWLDNVNCSVCTVIMDACYSGSFIRALSQENRIIITSTTPYTVGIAFGDWGSVFSYFFFNKLSENASYGEAWEYADKKLKRMKIEEMPPVPEVGTIEEIYVKIYVKFMICVLQHPQIDDNGDGKGHGTVFADKLPLDGDGYLALSTYPS
ncbi:MAG: hypothetical protein J7K38_04670 [Thermoplasmata archaeon]|nr:hypothetical protein [Thermoplasmata archaeon]